MKNMNVKGYVCCRNINCGGKGLSGGLNRIINVYIHGLSFWYIKYYSNCTSVKKWFKSMVYEKLFVFTLADSNAPFPAVLTLHLHSFPWCAWYVKRYIYKGIIHIRKGVFRSYSTSGPRLPGALANWCPGEELWCHRSCSECSWNCNVSWMIYN